MEHVFSSNLPVRMSDEQTPELTPETYTNRELSWIEFNRRVLALGQDCSLPLLERARFLAIFSTNLDEFYMVRVAGWHKRMQLGLSTTRPDGMQPRPLLREIRRRVTTLMLQQRAEMRGKVGFVQQDQTVGSRHRGLDGPHAPADAVPAEQQPRPVHGKGRKDDGRLGRISGRSR